ncbi:MAG: hypothetical protein RLZZ450_6761 [Pseudomonadota bacterium]|jgi:uncharacterized protein (DUF58 family)
MEQPPVADHDLALDRTLLRTLESLAIAARRQATGRERGERNSSQAGSGIAFAGHRAYAPGDDFRFLDWQAYARSDRLYVKQYEEERDLSVHLLIDCSGSMGSGDGKKFVRALQLAAALGYIALSNLDRVSVLPYAREPAPRLAPLRGRSRALVLLRFLSALRADGPTDLPRAARAVCAREVRGGLALVLSDGFDSEGLLAGVDQLRYGRLSPVVLVVTDPRDAAPTLRGPVTLIDRETGRERTLYVDERVLARYRAAYHERMEGLLCALRERHVTALAVSVDTPFERAVLELLRRGGVVR